MRGFDIVGRKRLPESEKKSNVWVRLPNPVIWDLEKEGKINEVLQRIILEYHQKISNKHKL